MTGLAPSLLAACARWPSRPAVTFRGDTLTYGALGQRVRALASAYRSLGIGPGDRVVCQMPTQPEHLIAAGAAWACGAVHVGAHRDLTPPELAALAARADATAVVVQPPPGLDDPHASARAVRAERPSATVIAHEVAGHEVPGHDGPRLADLLTGPAPDPPAPDGPRDTALLLRTSGTTGEPKLVQETLPALWGKVAFFAEAVEPGADDVHLVYLPIAHVFGLKLALMGLASGGRLVLLDPFSPDTALRTVRDEGVTVVSGSPTHLTLLVRRLQETDARVAGLRWAVTAAAPLPPALVDSVPDRLGADLYYVYGCSEGFLVATTDRGHIARGAVGRTVFRGPAGTPPDGSLRVVDPDTGATLPTGATGEITFGARCPVRYWRQPAVATDGWYRSGDLGFVDADGLLHVSGRLKEVINRGGLKVAAGEIEAVLGEHPAVDDCAVVPAPDPVLGEAICACVVPADEPGPDLAELRSFLGQRLARHKLPDELCLVASIPRSHVGKIDRGGLTTLVGDAARERLRPRARPADAPGAGG